MPTVPRDARRKFGSNGEVKQFEGWSIVYFISRKQPVFLKLHNLIENFHSSLQAAGIASKFTFLPQYTLHATVVGIATGQSDAMGQKIVSRVNECFKVFSGRKISAPRIVVRGDIGPDGSTVVAPIEPLDLESLNSIYLIRKEVRESLHPLGSRIVPNRPKNFHGHVSLAYMVNTLSRLEYAKFRDILSSYDHEINLGQLAIDSISLHHFKNMEDWGDPVITLRLAE